MVWWPNRRPSKGVRAKPASTAISAALTTPVPAFTPSRPQFSRRLLVGREAELRRILRALSEENFHVVLYSERGRGKTSLANLAVALLRQKQWIVARHTCEAGSDFDSIVRELARDLPAALLAGSPGTGEGCEAALPVQKLRPRDVLAITGRLTCRNLICVVDEFDRVEDSGTRILLADTIKLLSDRGIGMLFLLVGVSKNLDELLGQHPSIQRSVVGVDLQLLTDAEILRLLETGASDIGLILHSAAAMKVTRFVRGGPYMAHLMGLRLAQHAQKQGLQELGLADLLPVFTAVAADVNTASMEMYCRLTANGTNVEMIDALRSIADAPQDRNGRIVVGQILSDRLSVGGRQVSIACWKLCVDAGAVGQVGGKGDLFVFADRWLMYYILLIEALDCKLTDSDELIPWHAEPASLNIAPFFKNVELGGD